ncbi:N-acyl homoserine lactonase family protein [Parasphingopyxis lamellibrachiae]|uniref:Glyoxylase-like metal-dependent hydrolase (Beta-lactamase superfamily II) n=1 Tax=Parasphingopyxis lamellibrachiae TaxID=680125 RepID=A0A3D9FBH9_9SPHN|nr:N-acyl homoserine lactonase family protein [Parasphingopyxis lamellibrachiae]RED15073.1 glyoxylase-like metal-dependent hydrolase (beta-lactamase superfamily II) [Parasphingopyxis lamellibrachiae]
MKMIRKLGAGLAALLMSTAVFAQQAHTPDIEMWRLDCGSLVLSDTAPFSDGHLYDGQPRTLTDSCYLIRNGDRYLLWDAGLSGQLLGTSVTQWVFTMSLDRTIADQLGDIGLAPDNITFLGLSHYHDDHIGQAPDFAGSTLLMNQRDIAAVRDQEMPSAQAALAPWISGGAESVDIGRDHDVFGDGSVTILFMPGHTPGHSSLLVRLPETGPVLLTGDLYHFREQIENEGVPVFNTDRADTLASFARFLQIDLALDAMIVIQHDPGDLERLPVFPESAR